MRFHRGEVLAQAHDGVKDVALDAEDALSGNGPPDGLPSVAGDAPDMGQVAKEGRPGGDGSFRFHRRFENCHSARL